MIQLSLPDAEGIVGDVPISDKYSNPGSLTLIFLSSPE